MPLAHTLPYPCAEAELHVAAGPVDVRACTPGVSVSCVSGLRRRSLSSIAWGERLYAEQVQLMLAELSQD